MYGLGFSDMIASRFMFAVRVFSAWPVKPGVHALMFLTSCVRAASCRESDDGEQKVGGLRGIGRIGDRLRCAVRGDEARVAPLPALDLPIEESTAGQLIR